MTTIIPPLAFVLVVLFVIAYTFGIVPLSQGKWVLPAIVCVLFSIFSGYVILTEGLFGFWDEHLRSGWGNQIWVDLLLAVSLSWYLIVPKAKRLGMNIPLWMIFVIATASIGLLAMVSRLLYLEENGAAAVG